MNVYQILLKSLDGYFYKPRLFKHYCLDKLVYITSFLKYKSKNFLFLFFLYKLCILIKHYKICRPLNFSILDSCLLCPFGNPLLDSGSTLRVAQSYYASCNINFFLRTLLLSVSRSSLCVRDIMCDLLILERLQAICLCLKCILHSLPPMRVYTLINCSW